jgi:hypothetical protein
VLETCSFKSEPFGYIFAVHALKFLRVAQRADKQSSLLEPGVVWAAGVGNGQQIH